MKPTKHKEVEPVTMPPSSSISAMDVAGPQSLFVVVSYVREMRYFSSILQLDPKGNKYDYVAHFEQPQGYPVTIRWAFSQLPCSPCNPEDLCIVSDWGRLYQKRAPLLVSIFNLATKKCKSIKPRGGPIYYKHVVDMKTHIYFMGDPKPGYEPFFARYDRLKDSWETLEPFPYYDVKHSGDGLKGIISATVNWNNNTILLNLVSCGMWAYDVATNKWYPVVDRGCLCDNILGMTVVLDDTVYAMTKGETLIVAVSISREQTECGIEFRITLLCNISVPGIDVVRYDDQGKWFKTRNLVHLGGDNLCIVQSCNSYDAPVYSQPIQVTYLRLEGKKSMTVTDTCVYNVELFQNEQFNVEICFSLPEYMASAFKEGNRCFPIDPFPEHYTVRPDCRCEDPPGFIVDFCSKPVPPQQSLGNDSLQTFVIDEQGTHISLSTNELGPFEVTAITPPGAIERLEKFRPIKSDEIQVINKKKGLLESSQINIIGEQGHCIHVFNIPPGATVKQLEKILKTFGPIKKDGIKVAAKNNKPYATVEFKAAPSKQRAIKASTIDIQGYKAVIGEVDQSLGVKSKIKNHTKTACDSSN